VALPWAAHRHLNPWYPSGVGLLKPLKAVYTKFASLTNFENAEWIADVGSAAADVTAAAAHPPLTGESTSFSTANRDKR
jgi:hypothetical protein